MRCVNREGVFIVNTPSCHNMQRTRGDEMSNAVIRMEHISKAFPGVMALEDITVSFEKGRVNVLLGENGAGKSTLIKILAGIYTCDTGALYYHGEKTVWRDASDALQKGISVIHQELSVIDDLTVAENIYLGREKKRGILLEKGEMERDAQHLMDRLGLNISPKTQVKSLSSAEKQMVEIARAISYDAEVVVMDEPTSSLAIAETEVLFRVIAELKRKGVCIIYISHRMSEIKQIGDTITILKDGKLVDTVSVQDTNEDDWIRMMVGRDIHRIDRGVNRHISTEVVLSVKNISNARSCKNVSFDLRKGEIIGISGLVGAGRTELLRAIFGADKGRGGTICIHGAERKVSCTADAIAAGIALVPEDRRGQGILLEKGIIDNIALPSLKKWLKNGLVNDKKARLVTEEYIGKLSIKVSSLRGAVKFMSGGNQQKVVLSKWLAANCSILFMDEPTRGIDIHAKNEIYALMLRFVENGGSIVMVSSELPEILGISDRILVMRAGEAVAMLDRHEASEEKIISLASIK